MSAIDRRTLTKADLLLELPGFPGDAADWLVRILGMKCDSLSPPRYKGRAADIDRILKARVAAEAILWNV